MTNQSLFPILQGVARPVSAGTPLAPSETQSYRCRHRWELPGNYAVFTVVMVIYHYVERIWRILVTPIFNITYMIINIYYPGEPVNIHIKSLLNIIQENNLVITTKKG